MNKAIEPSVLCKKVKGVVTSMADLGIYRQVQPFSHRMSQPTGFAAMFMDSFAILIASVRSSTTGHFVEFDAFVNSA
jgi:hypothetical protein